jgi:hypothetical protein
LFLSFLITIVIFSYADSRVDRPLNFNFKD